MAVVVFSSEQEFKQDAIMIVSRLSFDTAVEVISGGNIADDTELVLSYLLDMAKAQNLSQKTQNSISFYLDTVIDHNRELKTHFDF